MLKEVQTISATQAIVEQLISLIKSGYLKPGSKLPSEDELGKMLGVGRSSVREAKRTLMAMRLIEARPGRGSIVKEISPEAVVDVDVLHLLLADETAIALHEARELLEIQIAGLAAQRAIPEDFIAMEKALEDMDWAAKTSHSVYDPGMAFHLALTKAAHNAVLVKLYRPIMSLLQAHQRPAYERYSDPQVEVKAHWEIYESIRSRDAEKAKRVMYSHLQYVRSLAAREIA
ncbi:MAG: FadR family transcriptional regulator [Chloroflexi bacterium]|nr:FadR family transcriptional regulator [Chloroflexota bacterium]MCL5075998.1 FadR family transcriptional regulator [Chloroflexota bacterium]